MSDSGRAPQFTATNGPSRRAPCVWMARATISLPVPLSPVSKTLAGASATRRTISITSCIAALFPTMSPSAERALALGAQRAVLVDDGALLERLLDGRSKRLVRKRLLHVVVRALAHRFDRLLGRRVRGDHDDLRRVVASTRVLEHVHPGAIRHQQVGDDDVVGRHFVDASDRGADRLDDIDVVAGAPEEESEHVPEPLLVVTNEDPRLHANPARRFSSSSGGRVETACTAS